MRLMTAVLVTGMALACSSDPQVDVSGLWDLEEAVSSASGISCDATGELLLSQSSNGSRFTGQRSRTASCTGAPPGFDLDGAQTVIGGEVSGNDLVFEIDFCNYVGAVTTDTRMGGTFECPDGLSQQQERFTGTWTATR